MKKLLLSILAVFLFCFGYSLCSLAYPGHSASAKELSKWWDLRMNLYAVLILLCYYISTLPVDKHKRETQLVLDIGIGLSISDVLDRVLFDITTFTVTDIFMIGLTISISIIKYARSRA